MNKLLNYQVSRVFTTNSEGKPEPVATIVLGFQKEGTQEEMSVAVVATTEQLVQLMKQAQHTIEQIHDYLKKQNDAH